MYRTLKTSTSAFNKIQNKVRFPQKLKGTIVERWVNYWKNLVIDYHQMLKDLRTDIQDDPRKALKWTAGLTTAALFSCYNPTEADFKDRMKTITNEIILVSDECRNPESIQHLRYIQMCYNEGLIHYRSLGLFSVMYVTEFNDQCDLYRAQCSHLQPSYYGLLSRIVDVGMMGRWWNIFIKTANYDVNV